MNLCRIRAFAILDHSIPYEQAKCRVREGVDVLAFFFILFLLLFEEIKCK